ncbi:uncharacterized protein ACN2A1_003159 [Glossina fuscipes fuscipes]
MKRFLQIKNFIKTLRNLFSKIDLKKKIFSLLYKLKMSNNSPGVRHKSDQSENETSPAANELVLLNNPTSPKDNSNVNQKQQQQQQEQKLEMDPTEIADLDCLLVLDTTSECAPLHLQYVLSSIDCHQSSGELLFLLVYTVALESGYICEADYDLCKGSILRLSATSSFHSKNALRLSRFYGFGVSYGLCHETTFHL